jgi:ABC-type bacteriocin/lantibiotic exporter with double-glycine peptidase domain
MFSLFNQYENPVAVTIQLLKRLHVKVTSYAIVKAILNHPDYPSILSISDALNTWHVDNAAINIEPEKLTELPLPFVAFTKTNGGIFVTVTNIENDSIVYSSGTSIEHSKPLASFIKDFSGIVLLAQANETSGQSGYNEAKRKETMQQIKISLFIWLVLY